MITKLTNTSTRQATIDMLGRMARNADVHMTTTIKRSWLGDRAYMTFEFSATSRLHQDLAQVLVEAGGVRSITFS